MLPQLRKIERKKGEKVPHKDLGFKIWEIFLFSLVSDANLATSSPHNRPY